MTSSGASLGIVLGAMLIKRRTGASFLQAHSANNTPSALSMRVAQKALPRERVRVARLATKRINDVPTVWQKA